MPDKSSASEKKEPFISKVAKVVDNGYALVINKGREHGVNIGDSFVVYSDEGDVIDPDTHQSLGNLKVNRGRGRVSQLQEKYAIISSENFETRNHGAENRFGQSFALGSLLGGTPKVRTTFNKADIGDIAERD